MSAVHIEKEEAFQQALQKAYQSGEPVHVTGPGARFDEMSGYTIESLQQEAPNASVGWVPAETRVPLAQYGSELYSPATGRNAVVAHCHTTAANASPELHAACWDLSVFAAWRKKAPCLWLGGSSEAQLHFDPYDNVLFQVSGRKRFVVYEASATYGVRGFQVGCAPRKQHNGRLIGSSALALEGWLEPGDALIIPSGSLHCLFGEPDSLSVSIFLSGGPAPGHPLLRARYQLLFRLPAVLLHRLPKVGQLLIRAVGLGESLATYRAAPVLYNFLVHSWRREPARRVTDVE